MNIFLVFFYEPAKLFLSLGYFPAILKVPSIKFVRIEAFGRLRGSNEFHDDYDKAT